MSERADSRLQPGEVISDIRKLDALRYEVREWESEIIPLMLVIDTAETAEERMTRPSLGRVREFAEELDVPFSYCGRYRCIAPDDAPNVQQSGRG